MFAPLLRRWSLLLLALLLAGLLPATPGYAATVIVVDEVQDGPDLVQGDGICSARSNPGPIGGACTLRAAVMEANARPGPDVIEVPFGFYSLRPPDPSQDTSLSGDRNILSELTIIGRSRPGLDAQPVIQGGGDNVFTISTRHNPALVLQQRRD